MRRTYLPELPKPCAWALGAVLAAFALCLNAQEPQERDSAQETNTNETWEQLWQEMLADDEGEEDAHDDEYERLYELAHNPLDINNATKEQLRQLPFLTDTQVEAIMDYRRSYGPVRSARELKMVSALGQWETAMLPFFIYAGSQEDEEEGTSYQHAWPRRKKPHSELTITGRLPFQRRKGDDNGYLGYRYRHSLRYEYGKGDRLRIGFIGSQDSGEPFLAKGNKWGYDYYSYYVMTGKMGLLDKAIVGKYRVTAGMGLVLGSSFAMGKLNALQSMARQPTALRPHSSRSQADYFRGAAATLAFLRKGRQDDAPLTATIFASHRPADATLNDDGTAATIGSSGYHRTPAEMERKNNTHLTAIGARIAYKHKAWNTALNAVTTHTDRSLQPPTALYRQHSPKGNNFTNASIDYAYSTPKLTIGGETAVNRNGAVATVNKIGWQPADNMALMALWRLYSYRYNGLYSHSFGDNSTAQNESGLFIGATWRPARRLTLMAYADYAYFPWAKYLVSQSSRACDFMMQADYRTRRWKLTARARAHLRQRDDEAKTALTDNNNYRARLSATYAPSKKWSTQTQVDLSRAYYLKASQGWMLSERLTLQKRSWLASATAALFRTDDFNSRICLYERQMAHEFYLPAYAGEGMRLAATARIALGKRLRLTARIGYTKYFDRATIGTGLQQTDDSHTTDLDLQLQYKLF